MISVIIPTFNLANYIDDCLMSISEQTYTDFEVIIIDNLSNDGTAEKIEKWAESDSRIHPVYKKAGVSEARNIGLSIASGEYVAFIDGDDYISSELFSKAISTLEYTKSDVVFFGWSETYKDGNNSIVLLQTKDKVIDNAKALNECITRPPQKFNPYIWNKIYRKSALYNNGLILFDTNLSYSEDAIWLTKVLINSSSISLYNEPLYFYRCDRPGNSTAVVWGNDALNLKHMKSAVLSMEEVYELLNISQVNNGAANNALQRSISHCANGMKKALKYNNREIFNFCSSHFKQSFPVFMRKDKSLIGFIWGIKKVFEYAACCLRYYLK